MSPELSLGLDILGTSTPWWYFALTLAVAAVLVVAVYVVTRAWQIALILATVAAVFVGVAWVQEQWGGQP